MDERFSNELQRQIRAYQDIGFVDASGYDQGQWYGGFTSMFYRDRDDRPEQFPSAIDSVDMAPSEGIPFLLVMGESTVSIPKQMQLLNGAGWNSGGTGKPDLFRGMMGLSSRMWLAFNVQLHQVDSRAPRRGLPNDHEDALFNADGSPKESLKWNASLEITHWEVYEKIKATGRVLGTVCDGIALAVAYPDLLKKHGVVGLFASASNDYEAPYIHAEPYEWNRLPKGKPNLFSHSVGRNVFSGDGAIMSYSHVLTVEDVCKNSTARYQAKCARRA